MAEKSDRLHTFSNGIYHSTDEHSPLSPAVLTETKQSNRLQGKVTLIVGGASQNGRDLAIGLAERGSDVVLIYFNDDTVMANQIQHQVEMRGRRCLTINGAVRGQQFSEQAVQKVMHTFGRIDVFISLSTPPSVNNDLLTQEERTRDDPHPLRSYIFPDFYMLKEVLNQMTD